MVTLMLSLMMSNAVASDGSQAWTVVDLAPLELPPSRTRCSLASIDKADYLEFEWDPMTSAQVVQRLVLHTAGSYRVSCIGEMLPALRQPVLGEGVGHPTRWVGSVDFRVGTGKIVPIGDERIVGGVSDCKPATDHPETPLVVCKPRVVGLSIRGFDRSDRKDGVLPGGPSLLEENARGSELGLASSPDRFLAASSAVLVDRFLALAADVVVTEVRAEGLESARTLLLRSLSCDAAAPSFSATCGVLRRASMEQLVSQHDVLVRALLADLVAEAVRQLPNDASRPEIALTAKLLPVALIVLAGGVVTDAETVRAVLDVAPQVPELEAAVEVIDQCRAVHCSRTTAKRLLALAAKKQGDFDRAWSALVLIEGITAPADAATPLERLRSAVALARLVHARNASAGGDQKVSHALDALDAAMRRDIAAAARHVGQLVGTDDKLNRVLSLAIALGVALPEIKNAATMDDAAWAKRAEAYKSAILAWRRAQLRRRDAPARTVVASFGGTLGIEGGASIGEHSDVEASARVGLPIEIGLDLYVGRGHSLRFAASPLDAGSYAVAALSRADGDSGAEKLGERVLKAQRLSASVGFVARGDRAMPTIAAVFSHVPDEASWFVGGRVGFLVPFFDQRVAAPPRRADAR